MCHYPYALAQKVKTVMYGNTQNESPVLVNNEELSPS